MKRIISAVLSVALTLSALTVAAAPTAASVDNPGQCWGTAGYFILFNGDGQTGTWEVHCIPIIQGTRNDNSHAQTDGTVVDFEDFKNKAESGILNLYQSSVTGYECGVTSFIYDGYGRTLDEWGQPVEIYAETPGWLEGDNGVDRVTYFEISDGKDNENQSHTMGIGCYPAS